MPPGHHRDCGVADPARGEVHLLPNPRSAPPGDHAGPRASPPAHERWCSGARGARAPLRGRVAPL